MGTIKQQRKAMTLMVLCAVLWSAGGIFIKWISWNPLLISGGRGLFSAAIIGLFMLKTGIKLKINKYSVIAGIGLAGCCTNFVIANKLTTAANAIVLQYTSPVFILLISAIFFKAKMLRRDVTVVLATIAGIALFFFDQLSPGNILGNIIAIISGVFFAVMFVAIGQAHEDDSIRMSGVFLGQLLTFAIGMMSVPFTDFHPTSREILLVVILGVFQLGIPYILYAIAARNCTPLACSLIGTLEPLLNPVWVFLFAGEAPGMFALFGAVIVIAAISTWCILQNKSLRIQADESVDDFDNTTTISPL